MAQQKRVPKEVQITCTTTTILKIVGVLGIVVLLYFLRDIVALVLVALLIAVSVDPIVDWLSRHHIPRVLAAIVTFIIIICLFSGVLLLVIPQVLTQASGFISDYSWLIEDITGGTLSTQGFVSGADLSQNARAIFQTVRQSGFTEALPGLAAFFSSIFGGILQIILVFALAFYVVIEEQTLRSSILKILPKAYKKRFEKLLPIVREKIGSWLRGQLSLMTIMFAVTYIILRLLDIPFALILALMAGVMDIIPFIGAIIVFFPIVLIAFSASPAQGFLVAIALLINQQIHGDIVTPKIMQRAAGMNPVLTIIALLIGFEIAGIAGAVLAIPCAMLLGVFIHEWLDHA